MRVLGIVTDVDVGAAIVEDGLILAAVNEERLSRMKLALGFPRASVREVLRLSDTSIVELEAILVATRNNSFVDERRPFEGWFEHAGVGLGGGFRSLAGRLARHGEALPFLERGYYAAQRLPFLRRRRRIRRILRTEFGARCPIVFVDHHLAHAASAYYTSGLNEALVVSLDGGGDGRSSRVFRAASGRLEPLHEVSAYHSLGNYYAYVTDLCGFRAHRHEGKITGLAAHGEPRYLEVLREFIDEEGGTFLNRGRVAFTEALRALDRRLPPGWTREDLAASVQRHFEELVARYVGHWARRSGVGQAALAGGVFANVRVNQAVHELLEIDHVFIHPGMGDGGLAVGAALSACIPGILGRAMPAACEPLRDVYLGPELREKEIGAALRRARLEPELLEAPIEHEIARLLVEGFVVARADGRMEYGPRALGNRSILYQPTDPSVNDWLNRQLRRTEFMPFAPSTLYEERDHCFERTAGAEHAAEFMTITFRSSPWMRERMPGVVHVDGTARPQLVREDRNPSFYRIIRSFFELTGHPAIINTSFNIHEEPIVCDAEDCVGAFLAAKLDYLAIGPYLVRHPAGVSRRLRPVRMTSSVGTFGSRTGDRNHRDRAVRVDSEPQALPGPFLVDAHVHLRDCFDERVFFGAAARNFERATRELGLPPSTTGCLLLADPPGESTFARLRTSDGGEAPDGWSFERTAEEISLLARGPTGRAILLVAGRQLTTAEGLEVLALGASDDFPVAGTLHDTVRAVLDAGAIAVVPWGLGKWWFRRRAAVVELLASPAPAGLFLGDNAGRPTFGLKPRLLERARLAGIATLPGTDPLPLPGQAEVAGRYGFLLEASLDRWRPAEKLKELLREMDGSQPRLYGRLEGPWTFVRAQIALRTPNRGRNGK